MNSLGKNPQLTKKKQSSRAIRNLSPSPHTSGQVRTHTTNTYTYQGIRVAAEELEDEAADEDEDEDEGPAKAQRRVRSPRACAAAWEPGCAQAARL